MSAFRSADRRVEFPDWRRCRAILVGSAEIFGDCGDTSARLLRAFYLSAQLSIRHIAQSKLSDDRKRAERNVIRRQAPLARRRLNVLWATLRDKAVYRRDLLQQTAA
ncbi:hypothetical protein ATN37_00595 [Rhodococcus sp. MH15]|nr:hypothetical protein [Rhodococcus sp. MH15]